jgi:hypothetical protein
MTTPTQPISDATAARLITASSVVTKVAGSGFDPPGAQLA